LGGFLFKAVRFVFFAKKSKKEASIDFKRFWDEEKREFHKFAAGGESAGSYKQKSLKILKNYLIPHHGNSHKPHLLHGKSLAVIAVIAILVKGGLLGYLFYSYSDQAQMSPLMEKEILELINKERVALDLPTLAANPYLSKSALAKANDMINNDYFAHYGPDGTKPWDWIDRGEYKYLFVGENLAMNFVTAESAHNALMASPTHKKNILNEKYREAGIAVISGMLSGRQTNILVQFFAVEQGQSLHLASNDDNKLAGSTEQISKEAPAEELSEVKPEKIENIPSKEEINLVDKNKIEEAALAAKSVIEENIDEPKSEEAQDIDKLAVLTEDFGLPASGTVDDDVAKMRSEHIKYKKLKKTNEDIEELENLIFMASIGPNDQLPNLNVPVSHPNLPDARSFKNMRVSMFAQWLLFLLMAVVAGVLTISLFTHFKYKHKPAIVQTLLLLVLISGLIYVKFHFLESGIPEVLLL
jgi:hypothetical protein